MTQTMEPPRFHGITRLLQVLYERINMHVGDADDRRQPKLGLARPAGGEVWLSLAGPNARIPSAVNVTAGRLYGAEWYGRIVDGAPHSGLDRHGAVLDVLDAFEADPEIARAVNADEYLMAKGRPAAGPPRYEGVAQLLDEITDLMTEGREGRRKQVKLALPLGDDGDELWLSLAGPTARFPGSVNVTSQRSYGGTWYGRIVDGRPRNGLDEHPRVLQALDQLEADPSVERAVNEHAHATSRCLNCGRLLTADVSVERGIGPICAGRLGIA